MRCYHPNKLRGVNLGGWLVLEKWMTPSLFANMQAEDETGWCLQMGAQATTRLQQHWRSFITREDFFWLAEIGINAVRIPIGYWLFAQDYPYHRRFDSQPHPFVTGGDEILAQALDWAEQCGLAVILDLHAVPGCQNGFDNGGMKDICEWHTQIEYREYTLAFLQKLAACYGSHPALWAIEILNEPHWDIASDYLIEYTRLAYQCIRLYCPPERVAVVFHDAFRDYSEYTVLLQDASYQNLILDIHRYQCFTEEDHQRDIFQHIHQAAVDRAAEAETLLNCAQRPIIVGEWSLGLDEQFLRNWRAQGMIASSQHVDSWQQDLAYRAYAAAQLLSFEKYSGWFFWSYKTETMPQWSFKHSVTNGWLPPRFS